MNGTNTINHEIIPKPWVQRIFNNIVKTIIIINLKKAVLYKFLNKSIIICTSENTKYNNAGGHKLFKFIYYILYLKKLTRNEMYTIFKHAYLIAYALVW